MVKITSVRAVTAATPPTFISFLKLNSSPNPNNKNITPISAQIRILFISTIVGNILKCGPTIKPAIIYPKTTGCFNFLKSRVTNAAAPRISAKSFINGGNNNIEVYLV